MRRCNAEALATHYIHLGLGQAEAAGGSRTAALKSQTDLQPVARDPHGKCVLNFACKVKQLGSVKAQRLAYDHTSILQNETVALQAS